MGKFQKIQAVREKILAGDQKKKKFEIERMTFLLGKNSKNGTRKRKVFKDIIQKKISELKLSPYNSGKEHFRRKYDTKWSV